VRTVTSNMTQVDQKLSTTAVTFAENAQKAAETFSNSASLITANSGRLADFSERTLHALSNIASRFENHSRILESASQLLEKAQNGIVNNIEGRQEALRSLADGLVEKSEQLERVIKSFDGLIDNLVERTAQRSRQSADAIRKSIEDVFENAASRFTSATEEIRRTASEVREELEKTRADVKRNIVELPEEAKQSTSAMRRAISEQINALKELSNIVAKTGRLQPAAEPARAPAMPRASAAPLGTAAQVLDRPTPLRTARTVEPQPAASQRSQAQGGGWIRDLLRSASDDDLVNPSSVKAAASRQEPHISDSLNSLSHEIARAIDAEAATELWDRYRRGERNVFTRRLYTLKGQQTFDNIQQKYRLDASFRSAVDQFCRDFERLLNDVERDDRDGSAWHSYLTSDTGKVYTMLAHASGRLR